MACYLPYGIVTILTTVLKMYPPSLDFVWELTVALLMFNSCLNPILYCWEDHWRETSSNGNNQKMFVFIKLAVP